MDVSVRPVSENDAAAIVTVLNPIIVAGIYSTMDEVMSERDQIAFIRGLPRRAIYNAAMHEGRIVGVQDVLPDRDAHTLPHVGHVSTFVALGSRGLGIGHRLSNKTFGQARERGYRKLMATVRADNAQALAFYSDLGFTVIGRARQHARIRGRYVDEILFELLIA